MPRPRNYDEVAGLVAEKVAKTRNVRHFQPLGVHTINLEGVAHESGGNVRPPTTRRVQPCRRGVDTWLSFPEESHVPQLRCVVHWFVSVGAGSGDEQSEGIVDRHLDATVDPRGE